MKLTTAKLKQIIKEELSKITEMYGDFVPGATAPGNTDMGYGKAPQDALEPNAPQGITADQREELESIIRLMTPDELVDLMNKLDDETKKVLRRDFLGQTGGIPDPYDLER